MAAVAKVRINVNEIYNGEKRQIEMVCTTTVLELKQRLMMEFPGNPAVEIQRLIFMGVEHSNKTQLAQVFDRMDLDLAQNCMLVLKKKMSNTATTLAPSNISKKSTLVWQGTSPQTRSPPPQAPIPSPSPSFVPPVSAATPVASKISSRASFLNTSPPSHVSRTQGAAASLSAPQSPAMNATMSPRRLPHTPHVGTPPPLQGGVMVSMAQICEMQLQAAQQLNQWNIRSQAYQQTNPTEAARSRMYATHWEARLYKLQQIASAQMQMRRILSLSPGSHSSAAMSPLPPVAGANQQTPLPHITTGAAPQTVQARLLEAVGNQPAGLAAQQPEDAPAVPHMRAHLLVFIDLRLLLKLSLLVIILAQDGGKERLIFLVVCACLVYMRQMRLFEFILQRPRRPVVLARDREQAAVPLDAQDAPPHLDAAPSAPRWRGHFVAGVVRPSTGAWWEIIYDALFVVLAFALSLLPMWRPHPPVSMHPMGLEEEGEATEAESADEDGLQAAEPGTTLADDTAAQQESEAALGEAAAATAASASASGPATLRATADTIPSVGSTHATTSGGDQATTSATGMTPASPASESQGPTEMGSETETVVGLGLRRRRPAHASEEET